MTVRPDWFDAAECRGMDPAVFFPPDNHGAKRAAAVCAFCPVAEQCYAHACATGESWGVWGGRNHNQIGAAHLPAIPAPLAHGTHDGAPMCRRRPDGPCWECSRALAIGA